MYEPEKTDDLTGDEIKKANQREQRKSIIKLREFTALKDFKKAFDSGKDNGINVIETKEKDGTINKRVMSDDEYLKYLVENHVYDIHLRSCLDIAAAGFKLHPKSGKKQTEEEIEPPSIYYDYLIPQLGFSKQKTVDAKCYIDALREFFESTALKIKGYNKVFPHDVRNDEKPHKGINHVFLQRLPTQYEEILKAVLEDDEEEIKIIAKCQEAIAKKNKQYKKLIMDKQIASVILNGAPKNESDWVKKLQDPNDKSKTIDESTQKFVIGVVRELVCAKAFIGVVKSSKKIADEDTVEKAYEQFKEMCATLDRFNSRHEDVDITFEGFIKYVLDAHFILKDTFEIKYPLKLIASSIKSKAELKFTRQLKELLDKLIVAYENRNKGTDNEKQENEAHIADLVEKAAKYCEENTKSISVIRGYDFLDKSFEIYSNVGKYVDVSLPKPYRVAVGIAIVKWINEKIELYVAENKRREVLIIDIDV